MRFSIWSHIPEHINPVAFHVGPLEIRWYGIMYVVAFFITYCLVLYRLEKERFEFTKKVVSNFIFWVLFGVLIGGRLGYVLFYDLKYFIANPFRIVFPFDFSGGFHYTGIYGMSYHGGLCGVVVVCILFCYKNKINFWRLADLFIPAVPLGYAFGRLGNFINGELYGRVTNVSWGMYFPLDLTHQLRHPSQLYEAFFEGIFLFIILWSLRKIKYFDGFIFSLYLVGYGILRFFIEFFREPDPQLGFILGPFTMGQIFCFGMVLAGVFIFLFKKRRNSNA